ncbi:MAG: DUF86 domain-containing protein [Isosphaeraceae bacterium]
MSREPEQRIADIILCCEKIIRYTSGMSQEQLAESELVQDAVLRNIEVIGEAAKNLPEHICARMPGIEWKKIAGMRDWLSHVYYRVDPDIVWEVVTTKVPELLRTLQTFKDENQP